MVSEEGTVYTIAVLGAGTMGHGIAQISSLAGYNVVMRDIEQRFIDNAMEKISWSLGKLVEKKRITEGEKSAALRRIRCTLDLQDSVRSADLVIEAAPEKLELKKAIFTEVDSYAPKHAILATNTSSLPITEIASVTRRPEKVIGLHFFNPPPLMPLLEIIRGDRTDDGTYQAAATFGRRVGKEVVTCRKDVPGFIVNRILIPMTNEAGWTVHQREATPQQIDSALMHKWGFPMGIFALQDFTGIDVIHNIQLFFTERDRNFRESPIFQDYVNRNWLGVKSGRGFYQYAGNKWEKSNIPPEIGAHFDATPILAASINEAAWLVENGVADFQDIEKAVKLGLSLPRGIFELADEIGLDVVLETLRRLEKKRGPGMKAQGVIVRMVQQGKLGKKMGEGFHKYAAISG